MDQTHSLENLDISGEKKNGINENNFQSNISSSKKIKIIIVISITILVLGIAGLIVYLILRKQPKPDPPVTIPIGGDTTNTTLSYEISIPSNLFFQVLKRLQILKILVFYLQNMPQIH